MRIVILSIALLFCAFSAHSQVLKSAGVWYFLDVDSLNNRPAQLPNGTELAYVVGTKKIYRWNRALSVWEEYSSGGLTMPFDSIYFTPSTVDPDTAELKYSADLETFVFGADGTIIEIGQKTAWYVKNQTGSTINKGTVVRASGTLGSSGRILIAPMAIDGTVESKYLLGIAASNIADGSDGYVIHFGKLRQFNTSAWADGDVLYATTAGGLTNIEPSPPNLRLPIAFVVHSHATNGVLAIRVQTGNELHELHDVDTTGINTNEALVWNGSKWVASNGRAITTSDTISLLATKYWTNSNFFPILGGTLTGTGGAGFIGFPSQVSAPVTPLSGLNVYAQGSSFNWKGTDGNERQFASTLTGGRTYTLPDVSGTFALGTGTVNRVPLWTATNTLGSSNIQDNNTAVSILNSKPFQLGQWTTAGRPTGTAYYVGQNTSTGYLEKYSGSAWGSIPTLLDANTWTAKQIIQSSTTYPLQIISSSDANNKISFNPVSSRGGMFFSRLSDGNTEAGFGFYRMPGRTDGTGVLNARDNIVFSYDTRSIMQVNSNGVTIEVSPSLDVILNNNLASVIFDVRSTTKGSVFAPRMTLAQRTAITPLTGTSIGMGVYQTNGTEGLYANTSAGWKRYLWEGDDTNIYNLNGSLTSNRTLTGGSFWLNFNSNIGIKQSTPLEELDVNGDLRVRDSIDLDVTPTHTAITGLLTRDATGWVGLTSVAGSLSYSGGVLSSTWLKPSLEAGSVNINQGRVNKFRLNQDSGYFHLKNGVVFLQHPTEKDLINYGLPQVIITSDTVARWNKSGAVVSIGSLLGTNNAAGYGYTMVGSLTRGVANGFNGYFSSAYGYDVQIDSTVRTVSLGTKIFANKTTDCTALGAYIRYSKGLNNSHAIGIEDTVDRSYSFLFGDGLNTRFSYEYMYGSKYNPKHVFVGSKLMVGLDSTFSFNTATDVLQLSQMGAGTKEAADLSKTESVYSAWYATDGTVLEKRANTEQYFTITSTSSPQTLSNTISDNLINQGGTQATFTLTFPASPVDGQVLKITYNNAITTLTLDGNGNTIVGSAVTTGVAGSQRAFKFYTGIGWIKLY